MERDKYTFLEQEQTVALVEVVKLKQAQVAEAQLHPQVKVTMEVVLMVRTPQVAEVVEQARQEATQRLAHKQEMEE